MKKIIVAILAVLYLGSSSGATIHLHYCMGRLVDLSFSFYEKEKEKCNKCGMKNFKDKKGCCKNEYKQVKIEKDQKTSQCIWQFTKTITGISPAALPACAFSPEFFPEAYYPNNHAPPRAVDTPIYICNCVFRI